MYFCLEVDVNNRTAKVQAKRHQTAISETLLPNACW